MALSDMIRNIGSGLNEEMNDFRSMLGRIRLTSDTSAIGANFRKFGVSFHVYDFDSFMEKAREHFAAAMQTNNPLYTIVDMPGKRVAIDYNGEVRGIYTRKGKPLAFFRPDYRLSGYASKNEELNDFRHGKNVLFS